MHFEVTSLRDIYTFLRRTTPKLSEEKLIEMSIDIQRNQILMNNLNVEESGFQAVKGSDMLENAIRKN